jgi:NAD-dependent protein deacetylase/lipoamidase
MNPALDSLPARPRVFVLSGAGISAESGIPTFRGVDGLWRGHRIESVATPEAFARDPLLVWRFYSERRDGARDREPNPAHRALARLEERIGERFFLCTQNVDPLHERAGSRRVAHMHGRLFESRCSDPRCASVPYTDEATYTRREELPRCAACGALARPHICWFGEVPFELDAIADALGACDVCLVVGTSGVVQPAASFASSAAAAGALTIYVGPEEPGNADVFAAIVRGPAAQALPPLLETIAER